MVNLLVTAKRPMAYLIATVGWNSLNISILWFALKQQPTLSSQVFSVFLAILLAGAALLSLNVNWFRGKPDAQIARRALILGAPIALYVIGGYLLRLSDRWIIAEFSDMTAVGLYAMAYSLGEALLLVQLAFARVWSPAFMRAESQGRNFQVEYRLAGTTIAGACSLFCLTLSLFSVEVLTLIGRASYLTAVDIMRVVLVGLLWYSTFHVTGNVLVLKEKTGLLSALTLLAGLVNLGVNFVLVPLMGAMGAAIATVLGYGLMAFLIAYAAARLYCGKLDHWRILHITLIGSGLSLLPIFFPISLPMRFFLLVLWGGILMLEMWRASREWRVSNSYQLSFLNRVTTKITQVLRGFGLHR
jgi:O-antigen/teichoic acid export membrane protein